MNAAVPGRVGAREAGAFLGLPLRLRRPKEPVDDLRVRGLSERDIAATRLACSWLLAYPDAVLLDRLDGLAAAVAELPDPVRLPLSEFLFEQLSDGIDDSTADGKARLSKICAPQINRIPQGVFRQLMLEELSRRTGISADNLRDYVATHKPPQQYNAEPASPQTQQPESFGDEPPEIPDNVLQTVPEHSPSSR